MEPCHHLTATGTQATEFAVVPSLLRPPDVTADAMSWTDCLVVKPSQRHGLGVFARIDFRAGDVIERVPCIPIPPNELSAATLKGGLTHRYAMPDMPGQGDVAWMLGYGALYNHAYESKEINAIWQPAGSRLLLFVAKRVIAVGDEIVYDYGADTGFSP